ncbi:CopD family protein [Candidatus Coxiella mudrowiae]|uniref:CopD family protein n=1 Tax=Candidatus Coxiella mudrowiae TaxID=2054173 RepID=UPI000A3EC39D
MDYLIIEHQRQLAYFSHLQLLYRLEILERTHPRIFYSLGSRPCTIQHMRWILAFHIIFVVCWFSNLFYLPRLFVYHTQTEDQISNERFKIMERKLFFGIMMMMPG